MDYEEDPFIKASRLLNGLAKMKKEEEAEEIRRNILDVIKDGKYNVKRTEYNKENGRYLKIKNETFEMTDGDMFRLIARMKIDPRLHRTNPYTVKKILKQIIKENVVVREVQVSTLKHGITVAVQTLKIKN